MPTSTIDVVSGRVNVDNYAVSDDVPVAATSGAQIGGTQFRLVERRKTLAERVAEAYKHDREPEETGLLDRAAEQFGRRLNSQE